MRSRPCRLELTMHQQSFLPKHSHTGLVWNVHSVHPRLVCECPEHEVQFQGSWRSVIVGPPSGNQSLQANGPINASRIIRSAPSWSFSGWSFMYFRKTFRSSSTVTRCGTHSDDRVRPVSFHLITAQKYPRLRCSRFVGPGNSML